MIWYNKIAWLGTFFKMKYGEDSMELQSGKLNISFQMPNYVPFLNLALYIWIHLPAKKIK